jgi:hypothetical protein
MKGMIRKLKKLDSVATIEYIYSLFSLNQVEMKTSTKQYQSGEFKELKNE